jgi:hypothetical protein
MAPNGISSRSAKVKFGFFETEWSLVLIEVDFKVKAFTAATKFSRLDSQSDYSTFTVKFPSG